LDTYQAYNHSLQEFEKVCFVYDEEKISALLTQGGNDKVLSRQDFTTHMQNELVEQTEKIKQRHCASQLALERLLPMLEEEVNSIK
jgi:hypothetical protein